MRLVLVLSMLGGAAFALNAYFEVRSDVAGAKAVQAAMAQQLDALAKGQEAARDVAMKTELRLQRQEDSTARVLESLGELKATQRETLRALDVRGIPSRPVRRQQ